MTSETSRFAALENLISEYAPHEAFLGPATDLEIERSQSQLGVSFPLSYKWFLRQYGAATWPYDIYGLGKNTWTDINVVHQTMNERHEVEPAMPQQLIPINPDGFGNQYCLDTSALVDEEAPVVFWSHQLGENQIPQLISRDFIEWYKELIQEELKSTSD